MRTKVFLFIVFLLAIAQGTWAENVTFNVRSWDETNKQVVTTSIAGFS